MSIRQPLTVALPEAFQAALRVGYRIGMLQQPDEIGGFLLWLRDQGVVPASIVIEIGCHRGGSTSIWAAMAADLVIAVDLPQGIGGGLTDQEITDRDLLLRATYPHIRFVLGDSHDQSMIDAVDILLADRLADLLFIDGDHAYGAVAADYEHYRGFVRPGGVIAFHDINDTAKAAAWGIGVTRFFDTLPDPKYRFTVNADWGGIGAIVV